MRSTTMMNVTVTDFETVRVVRAEARSTTIRDHSSLRIPALDSTAMRTLLHSTQMDVVSTVLFEIKGCGTSICTNIHCTFCSTKMSRRVASTLLSVTVMFCHQCTVLITASGSTQSTLFEAEMIDGGALVLQRVTTSFPAFIHCIDTIPFAVNTESVAFMIVLET